MEHREDRGGAPYILQKEQQRWEAVFRRERKPVSFDRTFRTCSRLVAGTGCFVAGAPVFILRCRRWLKRS